MQYIKVIKIAFCVFPFIAGLLTIPFLMINYRKYGYVSFLRTIVLFSFFLYLLCCYFLVVFPLPSRSVVQTYTSPYCNFKLFYFVPDLLMNDSFDIKDINTYSLAIRNFKYFEPICNVAMIIPFGMYLRYYFKFNLSKTLVYSFLLSLFFELTQLSGLYFIYSRPYRVFDINDLVNNTLGGFIGYIICPMLCFIFPSREQMDSNDYIRGTKVTLGRRFIALFIDYFLIFVISLIYGLIFHFRYIKWFYIVLNFVYFVLIYYFFEGYTFGKWFVNYRTVSSKLDGSLHFIKVFFKWILLHVLILNGWLYICIYYFNVSHSVFLFVKFYICYIVFFSMYAVLCFALNRKLFYDSILKLDCVSVNCNMDDGYEEI